MRDQPPAAHDRRGLASPGTRVLLAGTGRGDISYLLDTDPGRVASGMSAVTGDTLTRAQWQRYAPDVRYRPPCR